jgi:hypothetical protein
VVEAQHVAATMQLVHSVAEQSVLESILEDSKPKLPAKTEKLHYLLATPFRYRPHAGSRFRSAFSAGVWYGAQELRTALAEKSYWQLRFLLESPNLTELAPVTNTAFQASLRGLTLDLTVGPLVGDRPKWTDRKDYGTTQNLANLAREANIEVIRYESVRDPLHGACTAVLAPTAFHRPKPLKQETWFVAVSRERVRCVNAENGEETWEFTSAQLTGETG